MTTKLEMTFTPSASLSERVEKRAGKSQHSRDEIFNNALQAYLDYLEWQDSFTEQVKTGIAAADSDDFASESEVQRVFNKYRSA